MSAGGDRKTERNRSRYSIRLPILFRSTAGQSDALAGNAKACPRYHTFRHGACRELNRHQPILRNDVTARFGGPNRYGVRLSACWTAARARTGSRSAIWARLRTWVRISSGSLGERLSNRAHLQALLTRAAIIESVWQRAAANATPSPAALDSPASYGEPVLAVPQ